MLSAGSVFVISVSLFIVYALLVRFELQKGRRFFLARVRTWCDVAGLRLTMWLATQWRFLVKHTIQLSWYYSIHSALRTVLTMLVQLYDRLELVFVRNRERAKVLRAERRAHSKQGEQSHLTAIREHKTATALTPAEKKKLKAKRLRGE